MWSKGYLFLLVIGAYCLMNCAGIKPPKTLHFVVREQPGKVIAAKAFYEFLDANGHVLFKDSTNNLGYFYCSRKELGKSGPIDSIKVKVQYTGSTVILPLNPFNGLQDIYIKPQPPVQENTRRIADMHYHISMRTHNSWGDQFYAPGSLKKTVASNVNWLKLPQDLEVFYQGRWQKLFLGWDISQEDRHERMRILLENKWIKSNHGANNLKRYSQATPPHMLEGNVYLAFNAISPFEHSISNEGIKRFISSSFKSGAPIDWLRIMGGKKGKGFLTHWENFNREYQMLFSQDSSYNNFYWSVLRKGENIKEKTNTLSKPLVINVVEGGHILHDKYFPHFINFNIANNHSYEKLKLFDEILKKSKEYDNPIDTAIYERFSQKALELEQVRKPRKGIVKQKEALTKSQYDSMQFVHKIPMIDTVLMQELYRNIDSLKHLNIFMMAISHLSYNGLTGHAPAIDVSKKPVFERMVSAIVKRAYGNRVSEDKRYRKSFDGLFYTVPGINYFGDSAINRLLDLKGGRIHIDLKHSDVLSRKQILDKYEELDSLPPICSHCGVNGLPVDYNSPFVNEYRLLESGLARKYYTFGINLYNEEVARITAFNGIIGIPLEERVLGGYVDNLVQWPLTIEFKDSSKVFVKERTIWKKKRAYMLQAVTAASILWKPGFQNIINYYQSELDNAGITASTDGLYKLVCEEYFSAESFLNNMFHIVDIAKKVQKHKIEDSIKLTLRKQFEAQYLPDKQVANKTQEYLNLEKLRPVVVQEQFEKVDSLKKQPQKSLVWRNICIGSDLDGLIDPINICGTASQFPEFKEKLALFIPLYLHVRKKYEQEDPLLGPYEVLSEYFDNEFTIAKALDMVFYSNLKNFTLKNFNNE